jgi:putative spermidine/putrescine transport system permease protein
MRLSRGTRAVLRTCVGITLAFIYLPLLIVLLYSFNGSGDLTWPPSDFTTHWYGQAVQNSGAQHAFLTSIEVGAVATGVALLLGSLAAFAVARYRFFGRETVSFLVVLPIALPGIVTGIALSDTFTQVLGVDLGFLTVVVAHATFCIVIVFNNVVARLRRVSANFEEASADLGAHTWQTFWYITRPNVQTALVAGALLAFALSFDEIIVTTFTLGAGSETLPIWIFSNLFRPNQVPIVNVVAVLVVLISIIPVYLAHRLTRDEGAATAPVGGGAAVVAEAGPATP